jgi:hypothetical protein
MNVTDTLRNFRTIPSPRDGTEAGPLARLSSLLIKSAANPQRPVVKLEKVAKLVGTKHLKLAGSTRVEDNQVALIGHPGSLPSHDL